MTDEQLENILIKSMPHISPSAELNRQLIEKIDTKKGKRFHGKKVVALAIACTLMLSSITAVAATIHYCIVTSTQDFHTKDYRKIEYVEERMAREIKFIRNFACGFTFESMDILNNELHAVEESGAISFIEDYPSVWLNYSGNNGQVSLVCNRDDRESIDIDDGDVRDIAGINVIYETCTLDNKEINVSITPVEGSEKEEYILQGKITICSVRWLQDGVHYDLFTAQDCVTEEEMLSMAEELITSP